MKKNSNAVKRKLMEKTKDNKTEMILMKARQNETTTKDKNIKTIMLVVMLLFSVALVAGCASQTPIKSADDVSKSLDNVSESVGKISSILTDVDKDLGGG